jgi:hypothetical protein
MLEQLPDFLALLNDILEAVIVIFGSAVVLYNLGRSLTDTVMRAFCALVTFVVVAYLAELMVSRAIVPASVEGISAVSMAGHRHGPGGPLSPLQRPAFNHRCPTANVGGAFWCRWATFSA